VLRENLVVHFDEVLVRSGEKGPVVERNDQKIPEKDERALVKTIEVNK
jgi:hypothetical protein